MKIPAKFVSVLSNRIGTRLFSYLLLSIGISTLMSCRKCYTCTSQTAFGPVERDICGRKGDILPLIQHLETDTLNPWVCEKN